MPVQVVRLGTARHKDEGLRIGTVRRPPRGVKKSEYAIQDWYDVWLPEVAPSPALMKQAQEAKTEKEWSLFVKKYRRELSSPDKSRILILLSALSESSDFSIGCYCENQNHCHISVLRKVLEEHGALFKNGDE
ncbi:MAG: DUF488 domain-containing protein [Desulfomicrobium sp.]